jgi:hypothetical protein
MVKCMGALRSGMRKRQHPGKTPVHRRRTYLSDSESSNIIDRDDMRFLSSTLRVILLLIAFILCSMQLSAQRQLQGTVTDAESGDPLQFANVWVQGSHKGTTSDRQGRFTLALEPGEYRIVASYIGYRSQTKTVIVPADAELRFSLRQSTFEMPSVEVTPGDNPALRIIRKAIEMKEQRRERLQNYSLTSHSKLLVRLTGAMEGMVEGSDDGRRVKISTSVEDNEDNPEQADGTGQADGTEQPTSTAQVDTTEKADSSRTLPIILETQTEAYWAAPDSYKEIITARKQSAMIPSQGNIMISQFFIVDFSADDFRFSDRAPVPGPISERGLSSYYYRLIGTTELDDTKIYQIEISALSESDPLFEGMIYIADSTYALSMVDLRLNEAALPTMFDSIAFRQHFRLFDGEFWQPVDVVVNAVIGIPIVNIGIDMQGFSVLQDWRINQQINEDFFDRTRIKVLKEADERDSTYWAANAKIPTNDEEQRAYVRADSVKLALDSVKYQIGFMNFLSGGTTGSDDVQFTFPGLVGLYHFNRVEGHALSGAFSFHMPEFPLRYVNMSGGYGFNDERLKYSFGGAISLTGSPALQLSARRYYKLDFIDSGNNPLGATGTTLSSMLWKYDPHDYYYRDGWSASVYHDALFLFPSSVTVRHDRFHNAVNNSNESIFRRDWRYRDNPPINEGSIFSVSGEITLDARDFIDNAGELRRFGSRNHVPTVGLGWHDADLEGAQWSYVTWLARLDGNFDFGVPGIFTYRLAGDGADGALPAQTLLNLQGSMNYIADGRRFRTLDFREFGGDRRVTAMFTYSFRDWLFRAAGIPLLDGSGIGLEFFASGGYATMTAATRALQPVPVTAAKTPFWEAGFGLDNILGLLRVDFGWRLNHFREGRNFFFGVNAGVVL